MGHVSVEQGLFSHEVVSHLLAGRQQLLVVSGSGFASRDVMAAGDHPHKTDLGPWFDVCRTACCENVRAGFKPAASGLKP